MAQPSKEPCKKEACNIQACLSKNMFDSRKRLLRRQRQDMTRQSLKRVQSNMGAKNHTIILPDADRDATLNALIAAGFGAAGQRCMALSTAVFVRGSESWEDELVKRASGLVVNSGMVNDADLGPVISRQAKDCICKLVQNGVDSGACLLLDRRDIVVPQFEDGNFVGPTLLADEACSPRASTSAVSLTRDMQVQLLPLRASAPVFMNFSRILSCCVMDELDVLGFDRWKTTLACIAIG
ncbi:methylmalonate-semialdehyde dehydrogenase [acylating], mitochondrial-like [Panicum virgatum]|uniref:methylmalonate-semialdehyde dehydrogenase [acylating], mitochondrial-like n=1 Tax=Panicum virgatum TaxID=38727 RepID=UPI0019D59E5D|nr:methylmalonate-semialdehyde dehydrogenase [acylating], mitochondrial-like [Panicum virgatum]